MRRDEYLADEHVRGFTRWASRLVTGDLTLTHRWRSRGTDFHCTGLHDALEQYRWPDNSHALDYRVTARRLRRSRLDFEDIGFIDSRAKQARFVNNAEGIFKWGGIRAVGKLNDWRSLSAGTFADALIDDVRAKTGPENGGHGRNLVSFRYMGSGFSKVYSVLIDGFPIYDSRVACALNCLVGIYRRREKVGPKPDSLKLRMPPRRKPKNVQLPPVRPAQDEQRQCGVRPRQPEGSVAAWGDGPGTWRVRSGRVVRARGRAAARVVHGGVRPTAGQRRPRGIAGCWATPVGFPRLRWLPRTWALLAAFAVVVLPVLGDALQPVPAVARDGGDAQSLVESSKHPNTMSLTAGWGCRAGRA